MKRRTKDSLKIERAKAKLRLTDPSHIFYDSARVIQEKGMRDGVTHILSFRILIPALLNYFKIV